MLPLDGVKVLARCSGRQAQQNIYVTYTDSKGNYSFVFGQTNSQMPMDASVNPNEMAFQGQSSFQTTCEVSAAAAGFISNQVLVQVRNSLEVTESNKLILTPIGGGQETGGIVSAISLAAPDNARKEYSKGMDELHDKKFDKAEKHFKKATEIYPKFAIAWYKLGQIASEGGKADEADKAFNQAITADDKYVPPYLDLAMMAATANKWQDVSDLTGKAIAADPTHFPEAFFFNAVASFNLRKPELAEKSALRAASLDKENHFPRIQLLLAEIYEYEGKHPQAAEQFKKFLTLAPKSKDAPAIRERLAKMESPAQIAGPK